MRRTSTVMVVASSEMSCLAPRGSPRADYRRSPDSRL